jgi:hypothetical protein
LTLEKEREFSPTDKMRQSKKTLTDQGKNQENEPKSGNNNVINANKKLSKNSSQNSIKKNKKSFENIRPSQNPPDKSSFKPSISFQDELFCNKTNNSEEEREVIDFMYDIHNYANVLRDARKQNIKQYLDDGTLKNSFQELLKKTNNSSLFTTNIKTNLDIKTNLEYLNFPEKLTDKQLIVVLINLANMMLENKRSSVDYFMKNLGMHSFISILNLPVMNNKILYVYLFIVNQVSHIR